MIPFGEPFATFQLRPSAGAFFIEILPVEYGIFIVVVHNAVGWKKHIAQ